MLPANTILKGRYRIIQQLGAGGMGAVYQAMDENVSCLVAVKETFAEKDEYRHAFKREAQLLANLTHPALPHVMDHFTHDNGQFLVMQYVPGNDLAELLTLRERPFATGVVLEWADHLLDALEELHSYDPPIIHRDIKPSNLKLTPKGKIILLDFGLAKGALGQMSTVKGDKPGASVYGYTRHYAPLEQIRGIGTDPRTDLYSLGATLWSLLTGELPPDALARVDEKEDGKPDPLHLASEKNPDVPQAVAAVLHQAMALNRNQRPASAAEMRQMLKDAARQAEIEAAEISRQRAEEEARLAALERQREEEEEKRRQDAEAQPRKEQDEYYARLWDEIGEEMERQRRLAGEERERADAPTTERATPEPKEPPIKTLKAPPPEKVVRRESPAPPVVVTKAGGKSQWRFILIGAVGLLAMLAAIALVLTLRTDTSQQSAANENQASGTSNNVFGTPDKAGNILKGELGMELVYVPAGSFMMGSDKGDSNEKPVHQVTFSYSFYMGRYEVTQAQWQAVMGNNPSKFKDCDQCPVEMVLWKDAQVFISKLNAQDSSFTYRLPSEAEWEYACRAGTTTEFAFGDSLSSEQANFDGDSPAGGAPKSIYREKTMPVGSFQPNAWGLYDMHGNVWEWCADTYHRNYQGAPVDGSAWLIGQSADLRTLRGGSWRNPGTALRAARRGTASDKDGSDSGLRLVAVPRPLTKSRPR